MAKVLVVDDERSIRITLGEFLRRDGHTVESAETAEAARSMLQSGGFDVVLSDIILPQLNGVELLRAIREAAPHVQVILMTGEPTVETAAQALRAGATDYLFKPINKNAVLRSVGHAAKLKQLDDRRRTLEAANREYREKLEQLVAERTRELEESNKQLQETLEKLRKTQRQIIQHERLSALGQMASGIAHDFNNSQIGRAHV